MWWKMYNIWKLLLIYKQIYKPIIWTQPTPAPTPALIPHLSRPERFSRNSGNSRSFLVQSGAGILLPNKMLQGSLHYQQSWSLCYGWVGQKFSCLLLSGTLHHQALQDLRPYNPRSRGIYIRPSVESTLRHWVSHPGSWLRLELSIPAPQWVGRLHQGPVGSTRFLLTWTPSSLQPLKLTC